MEDQIAALYPSSLQGRPSPALGLFGSRPSYEPRRRSPLPTRVLIATSASSPHLSHHGHYSLTTHQFAQRNAVRTGADDMNRQFQHAIMPNHVGLANQFETKRSGFEHYACMDRGGVSDAA